MYNEYYGFSERPFHITPDPKFIFLSSRHKEALAHLIYGIEERGGFVEITGEIGTGKTTLCRALLSHLGDKIDAAIIFNPKLSALELLKNIVEDLGLESGDSSFKELIDRLNAHLLEGCRQDRRTVLIIDEAQDLEPGVLEQIRLLSNLETDTQKLLQIILMGQPELREILKRSDLRQLDQRITVRYKLDPLDRDETREYITHRLGVAGGANKVRFSGGALKKIFRYSGGTPRLINVVCDRALLIGYTRGVKRISADIVLEAISELRGRSGPSGFTLGRLLNLRTAAAALAVGIVVVLGMITLRNGPALPPPQQPPSPALGESSSTSHEETPVIETIREAFADAGAAGPTGSVERREASPSTITDRLAMDSFRADMAMISPSESLATALDALFDRWEASPVEWSELEAERFPELHEIARRRGLNCFKIDANLNAIRVLDLPCIIEVNTDPTGDSRYLALLALDQRSANVWPAPGGRYELSFDLISSFWYGRAIVFWKELRGMPPFLYEGCYGDPTTWLQRSLRMLGYMTGPASGTFDEETKSALTWFQRANNIPADGILGPHTKIVLYNELDVESRPGLVREEDAYVPTVIGGNGDGTG
ncbi:AAA family ATPase [Thermodesulfobacteriota bacterium]